MDNNDICHIFPTVYQCGFKQEQDKGFGALLNVGGVKKEYWESHRN